MELYNTQFHPSFYLFKKSLPVYLDVLAAYDSYPPPIDEAREKYYSAIEVSIPDGFQALGEKATSVSASHCTVGLQSIKQTQVSQLILQWQRLRCGRGEGHDKFAGTAA